jgi:hypothetical protein|tara:strand:- start:756 stop:1133 length:378 start_codon:yes stop_codon:yes gene_type:complete
MTNRLTGEQLIDEFEDNLIAKFGEDKAMSMIMSAIGYPSGNNNGLADLTDNTSPEVTVLLIEAIRFGQLLAKASIADQDPEAVDAWDYWKSNSLDLNWPMNLSPKVQAQINSVIQSIQFNNPTRD